MQNVITAAIILSKQILLSTIRCHSPTFIYRHEKYYFYSKYMLLNLSNFYSNESDWRSSGNGSGDGNRSGGFENSSGGFGGFDRKPNSGTNLWEKEFEVMKQTNVVKSKSTTNDWSNSFQDSSSNNNK